MVYLAEHPALAVLEVRVHLDVPLELLPGDYMLARVQLPDEVPATPSDASDELEAGDIWLRDAKAATMRVPSALVPFAYNLLLNPHHPRAAEHQSSALRHSTSIRACDRINGATDHRFARVI